MIDDKVKRKKHRREENRKFSDDISFPDIIRKSLKEYREIILILGLLDENKSVPSERIILSLRDTFKIYKTETRVLEILQNLKNLGLVNNDVIITKDGDVLSTKYTDNWFLTSKGRTIYLKENEKKQKGKMWGSHIKSEESNYKQYNLGRYTILGYLVACIICMFAIHLIFSNYRLLLEELLNSSPVYKSSAGLALLSSMGLGFLLAIIMISICLVAIKITRIWKEKNCKKCNHQNSSKAQYCEECGIKFK